MLFTVVCTYSEYQASPGNVQQFEDILWKDRPLNDSARTFAVCFGTENNQQIVGVAYADTTLRKLGYSQFLDNLHYSNLEV